MYFFFSCLVDEKIEGKRQRREFRIEFILFGLSLIKPGLFFIILFYLLRIMKLLEIILLFFFFSESKRSSI